MYQAGRSNILGNVFHWSTNTGWELLRSVCGQTEDRQHFRLYGITDTVITLSRVAQSLTRTWVHLWTDQKPDEGWVATGRSAWAWHHDCLHFLDWWTPATACAGAGRMASPGKQWIWRKSMEMRWGKGRGEGKVRKRPEREETEKREEEANLNTAVQSTSCTSNEFTEKLLCQWQNIYLPTTKFCLPCWAYHPKSLKW